jgi:hypothetical protein
METEKRNSVFLHENALMETEKRKGVSLNRTLVKLNW